MVHPWTPQLQGYLDEVPHVITVHDPSPHPGLVHGMSNLWETVSANRAARCVVLGRTFVEEMRSRGVAASRIDVIPHALLSVYGDASNDKPIARLPQSLLFFGRITAYKGLEVLIRSFRQLQAKWPEARLNIVGEGDLRPYSRLLEGLDRVTVVNRWVDDREVAAIFQSAEIVIVPYTSASQSGIVALAANYACPVIATRVGAIPEQVRDGETGILVEPDSSDALAAAIDRCLADSSLRDRLGRRLADEARERVNWEATSQAYLESCRKCVVPA
jgi:glycosyltransferase involved in cell wall biosynthesis